MRFLVPILALCAIHAAGQTFMLGTASDPCAGGQPLTIATSASTVRWGDFTCTFPVQQLGAAALPIDGPYTVRLEFLEPCFAVGACSGGQVTKVGQRAENVFVDGTPALSGLDTFAAGATDTTPAVRKFILYSVAGSITLRVQTVLRSGVLSRVSIQPTTIPWSTNTGIGKGLTVSSDGLLTIDATVPQTGADQVWTGRNDFTAGTVLLPATASLMLSPATGVAQGGTAVMPLTFRPGATQPAGLQWTFSYAAADVAAIAVAPGPAAIAAAKTLTCAGSGGSYICLATGINTNTIAGGVVAVLTVTLAPSASASGIGVVNTMGATLAGDAYPVLGMGARIGP
jgi:hypothetical protein